MSNKGLKFHPQALSTAEVEALMAACSPSSPTGKRNRALIVTGWRGADWEQSVGGTMTAAQSYMAGVTAERQRIQDRIAPQSRPLLALYHAAEDHPVVYELTKPLWWVRAKLFAYVLGPVD